MRVVLDADVLVSAPISKAGPTDTARDFVDGLREDAGLIDDPPAVAGLTPDRDDDYLMIALARVARADYLVSGDRHLTGLVDPVPRVLTPRQFLDLLSP